MKIKHCLIDQATARSKSYGCLIDQASARPKSYGWLIDQAADQNQVLPDYSCSCLIEIRQLPN